MQPCANKGEAYNFRIVVYPDATVKYVKDKDPVQAEQNKCAFELSKNVAKYMKGWNPAKENGQKVAALTSFWVVPDHLFENYKEGYDAMKVMTSAEFKGGLIEFRKKIANRIDLSSFSASEKFTLVVRFAIATNGNIEDIPLKESTPNKQFNKMVLSAIQSIKTPWTPAKIGNYPVRSHYQVPLTFHFE